jgi:hypothetical protein
VTHPTEPIDILAIASQRRHLAWQRWHATQHMQQSSAAAVAADYAMARLTLAAADLQRVQSLIVELSRPVRELLDV